MMAKVGDILEHPVTGEKIIFRKTAQDTGGELMQADVIMRPHGFVAAEHIHPIQEERFEVLSGSVKFRVRGVTREVHAGEVTVVPPGTPHVWWNDGDQEAHVLVDVRPALRFDEFFETFFGLAQAGKVSKKTGLPNLLVLALVLREFEQELHLAQPPAAAQRVLFGLLAPVGRLLGYQGHYTYPR
ncbi:MAG: cupin domain-containing protein [Anaerolinea sp.]|nr:cupin domain-containing protein [Anaerolinea sp.]